MASKYSEAEREAYKRGVEAGKKKTGGSSSKSSGKSSSRKKSDSGELPAKRSGCKKEESYKSGDEIVNRPRISGWRILSNGLFQSFDAYLDKNDGKPRNGTSTDECLVFVVNITTKGVGTSTETGVWSMKYKKLSITKLDLVANPSAPRGGYFGRGGSRYKDKVNK